MKTKTTVITALFLLTLLSHSAMANDIWEYNPTADCEGWGVSGYLVEELELSRWSMGQGFGLLGWKLQASPDGPGGVEVGDEGEDSPTASLRSGRLPPPRLRRLRVPISAPQKGHNKGSTS